jgi:hypothetical protein
MSQPARGSLPSSFDRFFGSLESSLNRLLCIGSPAAGLHQKHGEVRGERLSAKLPHHECDLTPMVSGMIRQMLHEVRQTDLCFANRKHGSQGFVCYAIHKLDLFFLDFCPP